MTDPDGLAMFSFWKLSKMLSKSVETMHCCYITGDYLMSGVLCCTGIIFCLFGFGEGDPGSFTTQFLGFKEKDELQDF